MSEKAKKIRETVSRVPLDWQPPAIEEGTPLLEAGLLCVLARRLSEAQAAKSLRSLRTAYGDWNELRVSQIQEYAGSIATKSDPLAREVAADVKRYLQEVYQKFHGFDLEFLREDPYEAGKHLAELSFLGGSAAHYLLWYARGGAIPITQGVVRVLDRLGVMKRTSSMRRAEADLEPLVPEKERRDFALRIGIVVERWCDAKRPICWECALVTVCPHGKKVQRDWEVQQRRLEQQRKKERERKRREEEKARRRAEAEAKRREAAEARKRAQEERKREREEARKAARQKKEAARAAKAAKERSKKKAAASEKKKKQKKKPTPKKGSSTTTKKKKKKTSPRKTSSRKSGSSSRKAADKPSAKKSTSKKPAESKRKTTGKKSRSNTKRSRTRR